ncbi:MAG: CapA family protein [Synergistaceae bacterium]|jgi:poly-gamma-glutamate synthesis protein (capsule biosynthesis protein)|nr:CapA family protein [Synergistaceae bacterium]
MMKNLTVKLEKALLKKTLLSAILLCALCRDAGASFAEPRSRVIFIGDIMAHKEQIEGARRADGWNFRPQFLRVKPLFSDALIVGNLETVFAGEKRGFAGYPSFNTPDSLADALVDLGVSILTLANNHILDRGEAGAFRTLQVLESAGILWTGLSDAGAGADDVLLVDYAGLRWAFVAGSYGSNRPSESRDVRLHTTSNEEVLRRLENARLASPDLVVAYFHWGEEYRYTPTKRQRELAALCVENGADLVIGSHPHVLQPVEVVSSDRGHHLIAWSLGNFVSYQRTPPRERSCLLAVDVERSGDGGVHISRVSVAPTRVSATKPQGRHLIEVVYAGESERFNHAGLSLQELRTARNAGRAVLEFLGAAGSADAEGFYTLWDVRSPDAVPKGRRRTPESPE